jgi:hypothetical protein
MKEEGGKCPEVSIVSQGVKRFGFYIEVKPEKKSAMHSAATCACFCAIQAYARQDSGRNNATGFVLSKRIYSTCVGIYLWCVTLSKELWSGYCTSGE